MSFKSTHIDSDNKTNEEDLTFPILMKDGESEDIILAVGYSDFPIPKILKKMIESSDERLIAGIGKDVLKSIEDSMEEEILKGILIKRGKNSSHQVGKVSSSWLRKCFTPLPVGEKVILENS